MAGEGHAELAATDLVDGPTLSMRLGPQLNFKKGLEARKEKPSPRTRQGPSGSYAPRDKVDSSLS